VIRVSGFRWFTPLVSVALLAGCSNVGYLAQSVSGHIGVVRAARPVSDWLADDQAPETLKQRLMLTQRMRDFAVRELHLPDNASYRRYADLKRSAAVWNVVATAELSLTLKTWCFPVVGCVGYRGYFDRADADAEAAVLRAQGLEVNVYGVPAYSTLGKLPGAVFADPLLNTFLRYPEGELARLIFHELSHQVAYAADDTVFNESFATAVERIGGARWLAQQGGEAARAEYAQFDARRNDFRNLTRQYRDKLEALFLSSASDAEKRSGKAALMTQMRSDHQALKLGAWAGAGVGFSGFDAWFANANNASLGVMAAYNELVPEFERLFEREGRDFPRFYAQVQRLASLPKAQRRAELKN
jgi:predicted aminopeptidase